MTSPTPPTVWALLLPEAGFRSQVLGLTEALGYTTIEKNIRVRLPWSHLPVQLCPFPLLGVEPGSDRLAPPWPDVIVACGRRTIPITLAVKRASGGRTLAVHVQDAKSAAPRFDLVVPMRHDGLEGPNVLPVDTAIHRVTVEKLADAAMEWRTRFADLPRPLIGVILGGRNRAYRFTQEVANRFIENLEALHRDTGAGFLITPSRRTEPEAAERFKAFAAHTPSARFWDGTGDNPYFGMLALCDALIVTEDSVSMVSEAVSTGKPVATFPLEGTADRHGSFIRSLTQKGIVNRFDGTLPKPPLFLMPDATALAAARIKDLLARRLSAD